MTCPLALSWIATALLALCLGHQHQRYKYDYKKYECYYKMITIRLQQVQKTLDLDVCEKDFLQIWQMSIHNINEFIRKWEWNFGLQLRCTQSLSFFYCKKAITWPTKVFAPALVQKNSKPHPVGHHLTGGSTKWWSNYNLQVTRAAITHKSDCSSVANQAFKTSI